MAGGANNTKPGRVTGAAPMMVSRWIQVPQPDGSILLKQGPPVRQEEEIGTREAAKLLGISQRHMQRCCDEGVLEEGKDWRRNPWRRSEYKIRWKSVMRLVFGE